MVSTGVAGEGDPLGGVDGGVDAGFKGEADGGPVGDGGIDGVASDGPGSIDGAAVGGTLGTWPSPPDDVQAAATMRRPARAGMMER